MTLDKAIELLKIEYEKSKALKWVRKPIAYSLYQVWKIADKKKDDTFREYNGELIHYIGTKMIEDGLMSKVITIICNIWIICYSCIERNLFPC